MKALHRKLLRDLWRMRVQAITVALTVACGVTTWVASVSTWRSLQVARDRTYRTLRFADVFAPVQRAPDRVLDELRRLPGVARAEGRISEVRRVEVPGFDEPIQARFDSWDEGDALNRLFLRAGRLPHRTDEVVINELFAQKHDLHAGDRLFAILGGRKVALTVSGVGGSPDHLWIVGEAGSYGDPKRMAVFWMRHDALADALGFRGAFNQAVIAVAPGASPRAVVDEVDRALSRWGSSGAYERSRHLSSRVVDQEIGQLRGSATLLPVVFLGVAAFLVNVLLSRLVALQREQLAMIKAFGYRNLSVALHYLGFALALVIPGAVIGLGLGAWVGTLFLGLYEGYFRFPELRLTLAPSVLISGALISVGAGAVGAIASVLRVLRLAPADAMRPDAPVAFRRTLVDRLRLNDVLPVASRMVAREVERRPIRALLSALGIAAATSLLVAGAGAFDSVESLFHTEFEEVEREDLAVTFATALPTTVLGTIERIPGVLRTEPSRMVAARMRAGPRSREVALQELIPGATLRRVLDVHARPLVTPARGLVLSRALARVLDVSPGDEVDVELLESRRHRRRLRVTAVIDDPFGLNAYVSGPELRRAFLEPPLVSGVMLEVDRWRLPEVQHRLERMPQVVGLSRPEVARDLFRKQTAEIFLTYQLVLAVFAAVIAVGVVYNNARIAFVTRSRELASMRILGFTRGELGALLMGEQALHLLVGIPLGFPLGTWLLRLAFSSGDPELYRTPPTIFGRTYAAAAVVVALAGLASSAVVRRQLRRLNLVAVLKAQD